MQVRIYKPAKSAMQSGRAKTKEWVLEAQPLHRKNPEPIMGWVSAKDTLGQIYLTFASAADAIAYAEAKGWTYTLLPERQRTLKPKSYADNFKA